MSDKPAEYETPSEVLAAAFRDLLIYGSMHVIRHTNGHLERTPPSEWLRRVEGESNQ